MQRIVDIANRVLQHLEYEPEAYAQADRAGIEELALAIKELAAQLQELPQTGGLMLLKIGIDTKGGIAFRAGFWDDALPAQMATARHLGSLLNEVCLERFALEQKQSLEQPGHYDGPARGELIRVVTTAPPTAGNERGRLMEQRRRRTWTANRHGCLIFLERRQPNDLAYRY
jgi:hypothetical protein